MGRAERKRLEHQKLIESHKLQEHLNCFSWYGFATGWAQASGLRYKNNQGYCGFCPFNASCWEAAKDRVRKLFPESCREFEAIIKQLQDEGIPNATLLASKEWHAHYKNPDPYMSVTLNYMQDGIHVAETGKPDTSKGENVTAPYPFEGNAFPEEFFIPRLERIDEEGKERITVKVHKDWYSTANPEQGILRTEVFKVYEEHRPEADDPDTRG